MGTLTTGCRTVDKVSRSRDGGTPGHSIKHGALRYGTSFRALGARSRGKPGGGGVVFRTRQLNCIDLYCICTNTSASDL